MLLTEEQARELIEALEVGRDCLKRLEAMLVETPNIWTPHRKKSDAAINMLRGLAGKAE